MPAVRCFARFTLSYISLTRTWALLDYVKCKRKCLVCNKNYSTDKWG